MYLGTLEDFLDTDVGQGLRGEVQLLFTSPPFPLNRKKRYGNKVGEEYLEWLTALVPRLVELLSPDGSFVMELGNAWEPGKPVMSTLGLRALLGVLEAGNLHLCQQFVCHNPARLPSPAQWVNVERIRVKDSFTHVWWMSPVQRPKASNRRVLVPYSPAMRKLLQTGEYNAGRRPSGHKIGETSFNRDNGGAIPPNVLEIPNTSATDEYRNYCRDNDINAHPAPMQPQLVEFFVKMLTDEDDLVFDPFAGSNTTGAVAQDLGRRWVTVEANKDYVEGSIGRFARFDGP
ncbi:MAG: site-specific DNA-methyltransferase [Actinomycetota bacterium]|nr:site-specific DNA-methyltransferase [Actinomycetota bacterium]